MTVVVAAVCVHEGFQLFGEAKRNLRRTEQEDRETDMEADFLDDEQRDEPAASDSDAPAS